MQAKVSKHDWISSNKRWFALLAGIPVFYVLNVWILGTTAALLVDLRTKSLLVMGQKVAVDGPGAAWYFAHPLQVAWRWLLHLFGYPADDARVLAVWIGVNLFLVVAGGFGYWQYRTVKGEVIDRDKTHGTARWARWWEVGKYLVYGCAPGIMFGSANTAFGKRPAVLRVNAPGNRNVAVFGPPGSGKTAKYICNNLFQAVRSGWSVVVTDPKGELTRRFRRWFEKQGYVVKVFNLVSMLHSDRWNPFLEVVDDISAQHFCNVVIANTQVPGRKGGDPFWDRVEMNLLKALVLYVVTRIPPEARNLGELYRILACGDSAQLDKLFKGLPLDHPARLPYNLFCETPATVRSGAIIGLGTRLEVFQNRLVCELTAGNDIDLELPGREKCAYFCILSDTDSTFNFLASLFFTFLFIKLTRLADEQKSGSLKVPVNFLLDEFCNISGIPDFTKKISTMRGRGIACSVIFQNIPQLISTYPDRSWEIILGDCDYWFILGAKEKATAEYVSDILGASTVEMEGDSRPKGLEGFLNPWAGKVDRRPTKRQLMELSEVARLAENECILRLADGRVIKLEKLPYWSLPWAAELEEAHINEYVPAWVKNLPVDLLVQVAGNWDVADRWREMRARQEAAVDAGDGEDNKEDGGAVGADGSFAVLGDGDTFWR